MKEEIMGPKVSGVSVAIVLEKGEQEEYVYNVYLINERTDIIEQVLVSSTGYGIVAKTSEKIRTNTLRRVLGDVSPHSFVKIEPIMEDVFGLTNEYWVSFWIQEKLYDKKFIFLPESVKKENMVTVPIIGERGVHIGGD